LLEKEKHSQKELILDKNERQHKIKYVPVVLMNCLNISELSSERKHHI